jgi:hypothetical protein
MTDKEMAVEIGKRLIRSEFRIEVLEAELSMYRLEHREIPWRENVRRAMESQSLNREYQTRLDELTSVLDVASPEGLLHILYQVLTQ